jgi:hypothetical protein
MIAIKLSWTRSPLPFVVRIKASPQQQRAFYCLAAAPVAIVAQSSNSSWHNVIVCVALVSVLLGLERRHQIHNNITRVLSFSSSGIWTYHCGNKTMSGTLGDQSYRSRLFIIIAIKNDLARTVYVLIPRDAVDSRSFSLLHMHMKFPSNAKNKP